MASGSIEEIVRRLTGWCTRAPSGLVRVEFESEWARRSAVERLGAELAAVGIAHTEVMVPAAPYAQQSARELYERLRGLSARTVSISGFEGAAGAGSFVRDFIVAITLFRERLSDLPLRQIWWMLPDTAGELVRSSPSLESWFMLRMHLTESIAPPAPWFDSITIDPERQVAARDQARGLIERARRALQVGAPPERIRDELMRPAAAALRKVDLTREADTVEAVASSLEQGASSALAFMIASLLSDDPEHAARLYRETQEAAEAQGYQSLAVRSGVLRGRSLEQTGDIDGARNAYESALQAATKAGDIEGLSMALGFLGLFYGGLGEWEKAEDHLNRSLSLTSDRQRAGDILSALALLAEDRGDLERASDRWREAATAHEQTGRLDPRAKALRKAASLLMRMGDLGTAEQLLDEAIKILELGVDFHELAAALRDRGWISALRGDFEGARRSFRRTALLAERTRDVREIVASLRELAGVSTLAGDRSAGVPYLTKAIRLLLDSPENPETIVHTLAMLVDAVGPDHEIAPAAAAAAMLFSEDGPSLDQASQLGAAVSAARRQLNSAVDSMLSQGFGDPERIIGALRWGLDRLDETIAREAELASAKP